MSIVGNKIFRKLNEIKDVLSGGLSTEPTPLKAKDPEGQLIDVVVDSEGRLRLAADVSVDATGMVVEVPTGVEIINTEENPVKVQQSGANVEVVKIMDALAITNTSNTPSNLVDLSKYSRGKLVVYSTLGVEFDFWAQLGATVNTFVFGDDSWDALADPPITIPSQTSLRFIINSHPRYREIFNSGITSLRCVVRCRTAPTQGAVTVEYWGSLR